MVKISLKIEKKMTVTEEKDISFPVYMIWYHEHSSTLMRLEENGRLLTANRRNHNPVEIEISVQKTNVSEWLGMYLKDKCDGEEFEEVFAEFKEMIK